MTAGRRKLLIGLAVLAALGAAVALSSDREERRIRGRISELEATLERGPAEIERGFAEGIADDVIVRIPEHPEISRGRVELGRLAARATSDPRGLEITLRNVELRFDPDRRAATVALSAELSRPGDELHRHVRDARLRFELRAGSWQVTSVEVAPEARPEPEARP